MTLLAEKPAEAPETPAAWDVEHCEYVNGRWVEKAMGAEADWIAIRLAARLLGLVERHGSGWVFGAEAAYQCFPEEPRRVRKPDASFIRRGRLPGERIPKGNITIPPDLAVEVVSPSDLYYDVRAKVAEYRRAGIPLVWVVDPELRVVEVFRADGTMSLLSEADELSGDAVLPGFRCRVGELFPPPGGEETAAETAEESAG